MGRFSDGERHHSGDIDEREVAHNLFVPQGPSACTRHGADTVARGPIRLASVPAVVVGYWWALEGPRCQVCAQDGPGYRCACRTCVYPKDAADVYGVSWRMGFNFGECAVLCFLCVHIVKRSRFVRGYVLFIFSSLL